jgi:hypothetical protein
MVKEITYNNAVLTFDVTWMIPVGNNGFYSNLHNGDYNVKSNTEMTIIEKDLLKLDDIGLTLLVNIRNDVTNVINCIYTDGKYIYIFPDFRGVTSNTNIAITMIGKKCNIDRFAEIDVKMKLQQKTIFCYAFNTVSVDDLTYDLTSTSIESVHKVNNSSVMSIEYDRYVSNKQHINFLTINGLFNNEQCICGDTFFKSNGVQQVGLSTQQINSLTIMV